MLLNVKYEIDKRTDTYNHIQYKTELRGATMFLPRTHLGHPVGIASHPQVGLGRFHCRGGNSPHCHAVHLLGRHFGFFTRWDFRPIF